MKIFRNEKHQSCRGKCGKAKGRWSTQVAIVRRKLSGAVSFWLALFTIVVCNTVALPGCTSLWCGWSIVCFLVAYYCLFVMQWRCFRLSIQIWQIWLSCFVFGWNLIVCFRCNFLPLSQVSIGVDRLIESLCNLEYGFCYVWGRWFISSLIVCIIRGNFDVNDEKLYWKSLCCNHGLSMLKFYISSYFPLVTRRNYDVV